jgi:hypothetical protein
MHRGLRRLLASRCLGIASIRKPGRTLRRGNASNREPRLRVRAGVRDFHRSTKPPDAGSPLLHPEARSRTTHHHPASGRNRTGWNALHLHHHNLGPDRRPRRHIPGFGDPGSRTGLRWLGKHGRLGRISVVHQRRLVRATRYGRLVEPEPAPLRKKRTASVGRPFHIGSNASGVSTSYAR